MTEAKKDPTVLLSALDNYGGHPFDEIFDIVWPAYGAADIEGCLELTPNVALIVWGGSDISPSIYHQKPNYRCGSSEKLSERDRLEVALINKAVENDLPIIGICRGAQLMCAMSGGSLVQHVDGHAGGWHPIITNEGTTYNCPSLHHQMMYPWHKDVEVEWLAWMDTARSDVYLGPPKDKDPTDVVELKVEREPEILWFPKTKALCIQSHPEFIDKSDHPFVAYCLSLTQRYILRANNGRQSAELRLA